MTGETVYDETVHDDAAHDDAAHDDAAHDDAPCFHGGAFFEAVGDRFDDLDRRHAIVNADVLDAWFPPAPSVLAALRAHLDWLARTSPPTACAGLHAPSPRRAGCPRRRCSSGRLLGPDLPRAPRVAAPGLARAARGACYGEYAHVLERVIGCRVDRFAARRADGWAPDLDALARRLARGEYDLVVLVNPSNPTGHHVPLAAMRALLARVPERTRVWIDEAYLDYVAPAESLETEAACSRNVYVCKSMSKVYALSGLRVAYLCGPAAMLAPLRRITPPWAVGLPAQVAGVRALDEPAYYAARHRETGELRTALASALAQVPASSSATGGANFVLVDLDARAPEAATVIARCRSWGVYLRDVSSMGAQLGARALRVAVKDGRSNALIVDALVDACAPAGARPSD
jgi:histidinol-phosphate/aromatic aminotransferase/cobyric acid decarboxylase-like protein